MSLAKKMSKMLSRNKASQAQKEATKKMQEQQEKARKEREEKVKFLRSKAVELIAILSASDKSAPDAQSMIDILNREIERQHSETRLKMKVSDFKFEISEPTEEDGVRTQKMLDVVKDLNITDSTELLNATSQILSAILRRKNNDIKFKDIKGDFDKAMGVNQDAKK